MARYSVIGGEGAAPLYEIPIRSKEVAKKVADALIRDLEKRTGRVEVWDSEGPKDRPLYAVEHHPKY